MDDELTKTRKALVEAELKAMALESLVETLEKQRDYADRLLLNLTAASQEYLMPLGHPAYAKARTYVCKVTTLDKYERRMM